MRAESNLFTQRMNGRRGSARSLKAPTARLPDVTPRAFPRQPGCCRGHPRGQVLARTAASCDLDVAGSTPAQVARELEGARAIAEHFDSQNFRAHTVWRCIHD